MPEDNEEDNKFPETKKAKFDSELAFKEELHNVLVAGDKLFFVGFHEATIKLYRQVSIMLFPEMTDIEKKDFFEYKNKFSKAMERFNQIKEQQGISFNERVGEYISNKNNQKFPTEFYQMDKYLNEILENYQIWIRTICVRLGLFLQKKPNNKRIQ